MTSCNQCKSFTKEDAEKLCAHADCPHKDQVAETVPGDVKTEDAPNVEANLDANADDLTLGEQSDDETVNKSLIGRLADVLQGK